jgi:hypothetical protein
VALDVLSSCTECRVVCSQNGRSSWLLTRARNMEVGDLEGRQAGWDTPVLLIEGE